MKSSLLLFFLAAGLAQGHAVDNHLRITSAAIAYLRQQLSQDDLQRLEKCLPEIERILRIGTEHEDTDPGNRFLFHFLPELHSPVYEPIFSTAMGIFSHSHVDVYCSSRNWAFPSYEPFDCVHNQTLDVGSLTFIPMPRHNEHTWRAAVEAGKSSDVKMRAKGWKHLGFVLHLLQDLTSPAHVRSDAHPHWPEGFRVHVGDADPLEYNDRRQPVMPAPGSLLVQTTKEAHFDALSGWTRSRFYSRHTVGQTPGPSAVYNGDGYWVDAKDSTRLVAAVSRGAIVGGLPINAVLTEGTIDLVVADQQWDELSAEAVRYTASLIYLFYTEVGRQTPCDYGNPACFEMRGEVTSISPQYLPPSSYLRSAAVGDQLQIRAQFSADLAEKTTLEFPAPPEFIALGVPPSTAYVVNYVAPAIATMNLGSLSFRSRSDAFVISRWSSSYAPSTDPHRIADSPSTLELGVGVFAKAGTESLPYSQEVLEQLVFPFGKFIMNREDVLRSINYPIPPGASILNFEDADLYGVPFSSFEIGGVAAPIKGKITFYGICSEVQ